MNNIDLKKVWDSNAFTWTSLARQGYDTFRDRINSPAFFEDFPSIRGLSGLDIGCGEGYNTRLLASKGAKIIAVDISGNFIKFAKEFEIDLNTNIEYIEADAQELPFDANHFDFVTGFMSFMDIPDISVLFTEISRVLKPEGFLRFSISHPCFNPAGRRNIKNENGVTYALEVTDYFAKLNGDIEKRTFNSVPTEIVNQIAKFEIPRFTHTLSEWINVIIKSGLTITKINEPKADANKIKDYPELSIAALIPYFLHISCIKR